MRRKIVAITSQYLKEPISQIVSELKLNCDIQVVSYNKFDTISEVYDSYAGDTDGFLISGKIAKAAIESTAHAYNRPIVSFEIDIAGLYRALLNLLMSNRDLDMDRIILDFLIPIDGGCTATAFLKELDIDTVPPHINNWTKALTRTSISTIENHVLSELIRMWNNNEMDMVLCQYSNILPELRAHGIPTIYPLPSVSHIRDLANELLSTIELEHMRSNLPVIINVSPRSSTDNTPENIQQIYVCMEDFFKKNLMNCIPQEVDNHCSALTTVEMLQHITHNNKVCELNEFLTDKLHFECAVGYGIGANFDNAIRNSVNARKEAVQFGKSFIQNENGDMIGPLGSSDRRVIQNQYVQNLGKIAKQCNLSPVTIKKVLASTHAAGSNKITTHELAERMGSTVRNANRIIQNLENGGVAKLAYTQTTNAKGRPVKVYELDFNF